MSSSRISDRGRSLRPIGWCLGTALLTTALAGCAPSQTASVHCKPINAWLTKAKDESLVPLLSDTDIDTIDSLMLGMMAGKPGVHPVPGCGLAVTRNDEIAYLKTYGYSRMQPDPTAFDLGTLSGIGSVSKTYTALATTKLLLSNVIPFPGMKAYNYAGLDASVPWSGAMVMDLLDHTAGLRGNPKWDANRFDSLTTMQDYFPDHSWPSLNPSLVVEGFAYNPENVYGPPANGQTAQPAYSNTGYTLLGAVIDEVSQSLSSDPLQKGYEGYVWHHVARGNAVAEPASPAMCVGAGLREDDMPTLAFGHDANGVAYSQSDSKDHGWGWAGPAGGWWATTGDLARLMLVLQSDLVIPESYIKGFMRKEIGLLSPELGKGSLRIARGLELSPTNQVRKWFGKGGGIAGYSSEFRIWPANENNATENWGVAYLCNREKAGSVDGKYVLDSIYDVLHEDDGQGVGIQTVSEESGVATVRRLLAAYASSNGRIDTVAIGRIQRALSRTPFGRDLLQLAHAEDWEALEHGIRTHLVTPGPQ